MTDTLHHKLKAMKKLKCKYCDGKGRVKIEVDFDPDYDEECAACHGKGRVEKQVEEKDLNYR